MTYPKLSIHSVTVFVTANMFTFRHVLLPLLLIKFINGQIEHSKGDIDSKTLRAMRSQTEFEEVPCKCDKSGKCDCCMKIDIAPLGFKQTGCAHIEYDPKEKQIQGEFDFNNKRVLKTQLSRNQGDQMCEPLPRWPSVTICARFSNTQVTPQGVRACIVGEARYNGMTFYRLPFNCRILPGSQNAVNGATPATPQMPART